MPPYRGRQAYPRRKAEIEIDLEIRRIQFPGFAVHAFPFVVVRFFFMEMTDGLTRSASITTGGPLNTHARPIFVALGTRPSSHSLRNLRALMPNFSAPSAVLYCFMVTP
jgi:hypothetical protein